VNCIVSRNGPAARFCCDAGGFIATDFFAHLNVTAGRCMCAGHVAHVGEERKVDKVLVGKPEGRRPLSRPRRRWEDVIKVDLREIGWGGGVEWIHLAQDVDRWRAVVNTVMNPGVLAPRS
jgi:hypothetical protein